MSMSKTPANLGFRMPTEWTNHSRTIMAWPIIEAEWPEPFEEIIKAYSDAAKKISQFEPITMFVQPGGIAGKIRESLGEGVEVIEVEYNDSWLRDNGPTIVKNAQGEIAGVNWIFNAWGGKYPCKEDNEVASTFLEHYNIPQFDAPLVMEGGSIHVDGEGTLLTTEECLLNKNRNPHLSREEIESLVKQYINVEKIIWLEKGLYGDETDGHIDNVACFARPGVIITQVCSDPEHPNYKNSQNNLEILRTSTDAQGRSFEIIQIEQPFDEFYGDLRLTLSYINFTLVNGGIILPVFGGQNSEKDKAAQEILQYAFPDRKLVTIEGLTLLRGGGNIHCLTQQVTDGNPARIIN
jgi:agmatine deiminase